MQHPPRPRSATVLRHPLAVAGLALGLCLPLSVLAQFKVVGPDGKVTYTDRPLQQAPGKLTPMPGAAGTTTATITSGAAATPLANLPLDLRQAATRYPVTLFVMAQCDGCDASRQFLNQRGIPYTEKRVGNEDGEALQKVIGSREIPALSIGSQVLRGFSADNWASYLDAAGYPRTSRLPSGYVAAAPSPLVPPRAALATTQAPAPGPAAVPAAPPPATGGIKF